jgi:hypothetical protein
MRRGVRDLQLLTSDLDAGSQSVIEALQRKVLSLEKSKQSSAGDAADPDALPPVPSLVRQLSVGSSARGSMVALQQRLPDGEFKEILFNLLQLLKSLQTDQSDLDNRRLKKDHPMVARCLTPHPEALEVLQGVGFQDLGEVLALSVLDRDRILRTLTILTEIASSLGIE